MSRIHKKTRSGFTLIEVMISIGIMTVGSLGILAMHQSVSHANRAALEMNTALAITERWVERVERDSLGWTEQGITSPSLLATDYLLMLSNRPVGTAWFTPAPPAANESFGFDYFGDDIVAGGNPKYCTNLRLRWLRQGSSARVDIRTYWYREGHMPGGATHPDWVDGAAFHGDTACSAAAADGWGLDAGPVPPNVDVVFASTVVTWLRREGT